MIRRLIRWIAKHEIAAARHEEQLGRCVAIASAAQSGFLAGHSCGLNEAFRVIEEEVRVRMGAARDLEVTAEDLRRARRGMLH